MAVVVKRSADGLRTEHLDLQGIAAKLTLSGPLLAVAGGRWGTYLGVPGTPIYFADLAVALGLFFYFVSHADTRRGRRSNRQPLPTSLRIAAVCIALALALGIASSSGLTILTVRDAVPFVYMLLIPVFVRSVAILGTQRAALWIRNAALIHLLWFAPAMFRILPEIAIPIVGGVPAFGTRGDFDVLICGLTLVVVAMDRSMSKPLRLLIAALSVSAALFSGSRAGLISAIVVVLCVGMLQRPFSDKRFGLQRFGLAVVALVPAAFAVIVLSSNPPEWAVGLQKLLPNDSSVYQSGQNTWDARVSAWTTLYQFTVENGQAAWTGFGFGGNQIIESGAVQYLSGDPAVRAAHNFVVTWFAALGAVGLFLTLVALTIWFITAARRANRYRGVNAIGFGLAVGIALAGLGGVILESPFGYMTLALALAYALQPSENDGLRDQSEGTFSRGEAALLGRSSTR